MGVFLKPSRKFMFQENRDKVKLFCIIILIFALYDSLHKIVNDLINVVSPFSCYSLLTFKLENYPKQTKTQVSPQYQRL